MYLVSHTQWFVVAGSSKLLRPGCEIFTNFASWLTKYSHFLKVNYERLKTKARNAWTHHFLDYFTIIYYYLGPWVFASVVSNARNTTWVWTGHLFAVLSSVTSHWQWNQPQWKRPCVEMGRRWESGLPHLPGEPAVTQFPAHRQSCDSLLLLQILQSLVIFSHISYICLQGDKTLPPVWPCPPHISLPRALVTTKYRLL